MMKDSELLRQYAKFGSEKAFTELVSRHLPLVFSAALRQVGGDHELAKDVAQTVFIDLGRKAGSLVGHEVLTGWLYTSTRFAASSTRRSEQRRKAREQIAASMHAVDTATNSNPDWERITPMLDDVMHELSPDERIAVLLRFFEGKSLNQIGVALGVSEDAARMRVTRALGKLHSLLTARGVPISGAALATLLATSAVQAAPAGLVPVIAGASLSAAGHGASLIHVFLQAARAKWKLLALPGAALVVVLTLGTYIKTRPSDTTTQPVTQVSSSPVEPDRSGPEAVSSPAAGPIANSSAAENQMGFELLDAETGEPISGAILRVNYFREGGQTKGVKLNTDVQGKAGIELLQKPYTGANLFVTAEGHVPKVVSWGSAGFPEKYTMKLEPGKAISGVVVDESRQPVSQVTITFNGPGIDMAQKENIQFGPDTVQSTDAAGRWSCNMIPRSYETIQVMLTHPEFAPTPVGIPVNGEQVNNLVLQIRRGIALTGLVADSAGQPVAGASVRQVHNPREPVRSSVTDAAGRFELKNLRGGELLLAVQAKGLAPEVLETNLTANPTEVAFVLQPGNVLKGRVVDDQGAPITNAIAQTDWDSQGLRKIEWSARTDSAGRFEWDSAPAEQLLYWFKADGFNGARGRLLKANGSDHEIVLTSQGGPAAPATVQVTGTVMDEETGLPLDEFKVLIGEIRGLPTEPEFRFGADGKDGKFSLSLRPPHLFGAYQVQIEKEGYLPIASTNLFLKDGSQNLELKMRKGAGPSGIVVFSGGEPVSNATVFLYEAQGGVCMDRPGVFRQDVSSATHVQTDEAGRFSFAPRLQTRGLIVIHEQGFAELPVKAFNGTITLQPWGRVEGKLTIGGRAAPNEIISIANVLYRYGENGRLFPALSLWLETTTDAEGNFVFEKVPPGERKLCRRPAKLANQAGRMHETHGSTVTVSAGGITRVELGGTGRPVTGKLAFGSESQTPDWQSVTIELQLKLPRPSARRPVRDGYTTTEAFIQASRAFAEAEMSFWTSEEGRALERAQRSYSAFCSEDGSFLLPDIPPATYELKIVMVQMAKNSVAPSEGPMAGTPIVLLAKEIVVPEALIGNENGPVDLGMLDLKGSSGATRK